MKILEFQINEFKKFKKPPKTIFYIGNTHLLLKRKISIVGSRRPSSYARTQTYELASKLSLRGITIVSGAAMGIDSTAHNASLNFNTIAVMANGLDIHYPSVNSTLIKNIEKQGLCLSEYPLKHKPRVYDFVQRNRLVVALGEVLIITCADINSGSIRSFEYAKKQNKKVYVLPHRINESLGTQDLIKKGLVDVIYNIDDFANSFSIIETINDPIINYCKNGVSLSSALKKFGNKIYEYELNQRIYIKNSLIYIL